MTNFLLPPEHDRKASDLTDPPSDETAEGELNPPCVMVFNASDPSGAGGLGSRALAIASVGAHALPVVTGAYARDTAEIFDHFAFDEEAVAEQARAILEDVEVQLIKVGFVGSPENLSTIAEIATDYRRSAGGRLHAQSLVVGGRARSRPTSTRFANWCCRRRPCWSETTARCGAGCCPTGAGERRPTARDIAKAAGEVGVPYTLVTGMVLARPVHRQRAGSPQSVLRSEKFERLDAVFAGAGDTLSAALAALLASGTDLVAAATEALSYMDRCLDAGFRPGMGHVLPDRLFWAQPEDDGQRRRPRLPLRLRPAPPRHPPLMPHASDKNDILFERARAVIPGGVNSPVRAFRAVGGTPRFVQRAQGAYFWDAARQALHRLHRLLGSDDPGPRPSRGGRGGAARSDSKASPSAHRPSARSNWPKPSWRSCRRWRWCGS